MNWTSIEVFGQPPVTTFARDCQVLSVNVSGGDFIDTAVVSNSSVQDRMLYFGTKDGSGITIGGYRQGVDTPYVMNNQSDASGGKGTVIGFYG